MKLSVNDNVLLLSGELTLESLAVDTNEHLKNLDRFIDINSTQFTAVTSVDLKQVEKTDSTAVSLLIKIAIANQNNCPKLDLISPSQELLNLIDLYNLTDNFNIIH